MNKHLKNHGTESFNGSKPPGIRSLANQSGTALVLALLFVAVIITLIPVAMQMTTGEMGRTANFEEDRELFYLAEAGLEHGKSVVENTVLRVLLAGPDGAFHTNPNHPNNDDNGTVAGVGDTADATPFTWNGIPYDDVAFGTQGGTYYFRVYDNNDDGDDNTDIDDLVYVESVGVNAEGDTKTVRVLVRKFSIPPLPGSVVITQTLPGVEIGLGSTTTYNVEGEAANGHGFDINGNEDASCPGTPGINTAGGSVVEMPGCNAATGTCIEYDDSSTGLDITGTGGGTPDVGSNMTSFTQQDLWKLHAQLTAELTMVSGTTTITTTENWGTPAFPEIHYYENLETTATGSITGYGILIVDSFLNIDFGSMTWYGVILSGACPSAACLLDNLKLKNSTIYGSVLVGGDEIGFGDSGGIRYSCEGLDFAGIAMGEAFDILAWNEVD